MKKILFLILGMIISIGAWGADTDWKIYPVFDEEVSHVVDTPNYVYFTSRNMQKNTDTESFFSLFRYDKKGDELMSLTALNFLNSNTVRDMIYNPESGYLLVLYQDYNIDIIDNTGKVYNLPYYEQSDLPYEKDVYSLSLDKANDRIYLATDFGYVAINGKKKEIAESRIYGEPLLAYARVGDNYIGIKGDELIMTEADSPRLSLEQYETTGSYENPKSVHPLGADLFLLIGGNSNAPYVKKMKINSDGVNEEDNYELGFIYNIENTPNGVLVVTGNYLHQFDTQGKLTSIERPINFRNGPAYSSNLSEVWNGMVRKGLSSVKKTGETWAVTKNWMAPNAPAPYVSANFVNHPTKGLLVTGYGVAPSTLRLFNGNPLQLSGLKGGKWTNYSPAYTNPDRTNMIRGAIGLVVDPERNEYVYVSSYHTGIARLNLNNPQDIIHISDENDADKGKPGFVNFPIRDFSSLWSHIYIPYFDSKGNLWLLYTDRTHSEDGKVHYYVWLAEDRKATNSASDIRLPKEVSFGNNFLFSNNAVSIPLLKNPGLMVYARSQYDDEMAIFDTNGTPTDTKDDKVYRFTSFKDEEGNDIDIKYVKYLWEDPLTGYVWICHNYGVCYMVPSQVKNGNYTLNRVKVSRNDGTNLADYLLDGVTVNQIVADNENRKWFATAGGGLICTTYDGREIIEEFNTSNSPIPSDIVYGIGYNTEANSLMISTPEGYAEYKLPATQGGSDKADVRAYPNPVRPEFSGYVTITDIPQGSFVKITDIHGNLVKDLGIVSGFDILWDVSDSNFKRVKSGVYHIMVSPSDENSKYSAVGKILVVS